MNTSETTENPLLAEEARRSVEEAGQMSVLKKMQSD